MSGYWRFGRFPKTDEVLGSVRKIPLMPKSGSPGRSESGGRRPEEAAAAGLAPCHLERDGLDEVAPLAG
jgi:hypothetical protein